MLAPDCLNDFPNLKRLHDNFEQLEKIKEYMSSPGFMKYPCCGRSSNFGGQDKPIP